MRVCEGGGLTTVKSDSSSVMILICVQLYCLMSASTAGVRSASEG